MTAADAPSTRLTVPLGVSAALHFAALGALFIVRPEPAPARPPIYRVDLVAAPAGPRQIGVVRPPAATPPRPAEATPPPPAAERPERAMPMPTPTPPARPTTAATPTPAPAQPAARPQTPAPTAGGGPTGGRGADVATVRTEGIEFPFPGYLNNVVRQIAVRFEPPRTGALRAEVYFMVRRDGSVSGFRFIERSGNYAFDLEAQGAVEAAGSARAFGPLPAGFQDDVLPVIFSFDPRVLR